MREREKVIFGAPRRVVPANTLCECVRVASLAVRVASFFHLFPLFIFSPSTAMQFGTLAATAPARLRDNVGDVPFFSRPPSTGERIISGSFPTSYAALSHGGKRAAANFGIKITGACRVILLLRAIVPAARTHRAS